MDTSTIHYFATRFPDPEYLPRSEIHKTQYRLTIFISLYSNVLPLYTDSLIQRERKHEEDFKVICWLKARDEVTGAPSLRSDL